MIKAKFITYNEDGQRLKPAVKLSAHVAWNEEPPIISLEIPAKKGVFYGVQLDVVDLVRDLRSRGLA